MEVRTLRYFLEIAREGNMTRAAERLHVSQPTLSRQMKELEEELGRKLFVRHSTSVGLTDEGMLLRKRAEDILDMVDKTEEEFQQLDELTGGDLYIGCAESYLIQYLGQAIGEFQKDYPNFHFHLTSGDTDHVAERLERGLLDLGFIVEPPDLSKYNYLEVPGTDTWGVVARADSPLAKLEVVTFDDLQPFPVMVSDQSLANDLTRWCGEKVDQLNVAGTLTLSYNGSVFAKEGLAVLLTFEHLIDTSKESGLVFRPLSPKLENKMYLIWKKYQVFSPIAERFLEHLTEYVADSGTV